MEKYLSKINMPKRLSQALHFGRWVLGRLIVILAIAVVIVPCVIGPLYYWNFEIKLHPKEARGLLQEAVNLEGDGIDGKVTNVRFISEQCSEITGGRNCEITVNFTLVQEDSQETYSGLCSYGLVFLRRKQPACGIFHGR